MLMMAAFKEPIRRLVASVVLSVVSPSITLLFVSVSMPNSISRFSGFGLLEALAFLS
jgi:hypothetical protein